ncbi:MAG: sulfotransferase [Alphaproteobacteria bacterium]|nr:sulfotransferase [Alphaproteobacteria bacterium]
MSSESTSAADAFAAAEQELENECLLESPRLREAAGLLEQGLTEAAAKLLKAEAREHPRDPTTLYLLAEAALRTDRRDLAEHLLADCVSIAPGFHAARLSYAQILLKAERFDLALQALESSLQQDPGNPLFRRLKAVILDEAEDYEASAVCWDALCRDYPQRSECWLRYGQALKVLGRQTDAIAAYRQALQIDPVCAGAYWALSALKAFRFDESEVTRMEGLLRTTNLPAEDRVRLHFALGQAYGDQMLYQKSFSNYAKGNALHYLGMKHAPEIMTGYVVRTREVLTQDFFRERANFGNPSREPIFIVGMPRSGSTLVEQILASHSQVEGTRELPELLATVSERLDMASSRKGSGLDPAILASLDRATAKMLGETYLQRSRPHRKFRLPFFTDKMPANFAYIGLIHLILPNARIIDIRRHPMACGFAIFTELFGGAQDVAYRLGDIGRAYRNYVAIMEHFDKVLPGKVHRIFYEHLVADPENEIRRLLQYVELPFEQNCLDFHKTERVVTTRSSEQVRRPIYKAGVDRWRSYEPWLGALKTALGDVLDTYPGAQPSD